MQILVRRLYNGGFNHLKRASSLLYRAPHIVAAHPPAVRFCATNALEINVCPIFPIWPTHGVCTVRLVVAVCYFGQ